MTTTPEVLDLHATPHPVAPVRQAGFPLDHPYLEQVWTPIIGPTSALLLRRCVQLWRESEPASIPVEELASQLGLGHGTARNSHIWKALERVVRFRFAGMAGPTELHVYTEVPPVPAHKLERLPGWCRTQHDRLLGEHLDALARWERRAIAPVTEAPAPHVRMAQRLDRITNSAAASTPSLHR